MDHWSNKWHKVFEKKIQNHISPKFPSRHKERKNYFNFHQKVPKRHNIKPFRTVFRSKTPNNMWELSFHIFPQSEVNLRYAYKS